MEPRRIPLGTTRLWQSTLKTLRMISAITGKRMVRILDELATAELERVKAEDAVTSGAATEE